MLVSTLNPEITIITTDAHHHYSLRMSGDDCIIHPYGSAPTDDATISRMVALYRTIKNIPMPQVVFHMLPETPLPRYLYALRVHNLDFTDADNSEHIIHTQTPRYIAHVDPSTCLPETITAIDAIHPSTIPTLLLNAHTQLDKLTA